jgi:hypothetical protein
VCIGLLRFARVHLPGLRCHTAMGHPATGSAVSILSHGWTRINTDQREISNGRLCGFIRCATNGQRRPSNHRAARRASALEFTIHRAVFGCRSTSSSTPPGARHAEGVNSSAEPRNAHRLSSPHLAAPSPRDRPQGSNRRPVSCRRIVTTMLTGRRQVNLTVFEDRHRRSGPTFCSPPYGCYRWCLPQRCAMVLREVLGLNVLLNS